MTGLCLVVVNTRATRQSGSERRDASAAWVDLSETNDAVIFGELVSYGARMAIGQC